MERRLQATDKLIEHGELAAKLLRERQVEVSMHGGIRPEVLQRMAGQIADLHNPGFQVATLPDMITSVAEIWGSGKLDERDLVAGLMLICMQHAHVYQYDLYEAMYDGFFAELQDDVTRATQAMEAQRKRAERRPAGEEAE